MFFLFASNQYKSMRILSQSDGLRYNHRHHNRCNLLQNLTVISQKYLQISTRNHLFYQSLFICFHVPEKRIIFAKVQRRKRSKIGLLYHLSFKLLVINWSNMLHRTIPKGNPPYEHINNQCIVHVISHHLPMQKVGLLSWSCCRKLW